MLSEKSQQIVLERDVGDTLAQIAERHGVSHQRVAAIVRDATELVTKIELDLMVARKTDEQCAYVIPYGPDYTLAMQFCDWIVAQLRKRDLDIQVETRRASNGIALLISDVTDYSKENR